jgi:hypothetical protein
VGHSKIIYKDRNEIRSKEGLQRVLDGQAERLSKDGKVLKAFVIDASLK